MSHVGDEKGKRCECGFKRRFATFGIQFRILAHNGVYVEASNEEGLDVEEGVRDDGKGVHFLLNGPCLVYEFLVLILGRNELEV